MAYRLTQKEFSKRLHTVVKSKDEKHDVLAARCGLSKPTFDGYLHYQNLPGANALAKLSRGLGVSADWLLFGDTSKAARSTPTTPQDVEMIIGLVNKAKCDLTFKNAVVVSAAHLVAEHALSCNVTDAEKATKWFQEIVATNILANLNVAGSA